MQTTYKVGDVTYLNAMEVLATIADDDCLMIVEMGPEAVRPATPEELEIYFEVNGTNDPFKCRPVNPVTKELV